MLVLECFFQCYFSREALSFLLLRIYSKCFSADKTKIFVEKTRFFADKTKIFVEKTKIFVEKTKIFVEKTRFSADKTRFFVEKNNFVNAYQVAAAHVDENIDHVKEITDIIDNQQFPYSFKFVKHTPWRLQCSPDNRISPGIFTGCKFKLR